MKTKLLKLLFAFTSILMLIPALPASAAGAADTQADYESHILTVISFKSRHIIDHKEYDGGYYLSNGCVISFTEMGNYCGNIPEYGIQFGSVIKVNCKSIEPSVPGQFNWGSGGKKAKIEYLGTAEECGTSKILTVTEINGCYITLTDGSKSYPLNELRAHQFGYEYAVNSEKLKVGDIVEGVVQNNEVVALLEDKNPLYFDISPDGQPLFIARGSARTGIDICGKIGHSHNYIEECGTLNGWMIHESPYDFFIEDTSVAQVTEKQACTFSVYGVSPGTTQLTVTSIDGRKATMTIIVMSELPTEPTVSKNDDIINGDLNGDKRINIADLVLMQKNINRDKVYSKAADMNNDGTIDVFDMILLKRRILRF